MILLLAFLVPPLLSRVRWIPVVVGEILAGILIGRSGLGLIRADAVLDFLAEIGLALLMFLSGLEIDFSPLLNAAHRRRQARSVILAGLTFVFSLCLALLFASYFVKRGLGGDVWMIALILSTTSLGVVLPVLKERGISAGPFGQTVLMAALMADFITMFFITIYVAAKSRGLGLNILLVGVLFVAALLAYRVGALRARRSLLGRAMEGMSGATSHIKVQGSVALLMAFILLAKFLGAEMILGAFLAGAVLSLLTPPEDLHTRPKLDAIGFGFFIPVFFISVGIRFDVPALLRNKAMWTMAPLLLCAAFLIKILPSLILKWTFSWRESLAAGVILSARLSLIIAAAGIGLQLGVINEATNAAFILIAAVSATLSPLVFFRLMPVSACEKKSFSLIYGAGDLGSQVAEELRAHGQQVILWEPDENVALSARRAGHTIIQLSDLKNAIPAADLASIRSFLALGPDDSQNLKVCRETISLGVKHVIGLVNDPGRLAEFRDLGVQTFAPAIYRATILALMARNPDLFHMLTAARRDHEVLEIRVRNSAIAGLPLRSLNLGGDILVLTVRRDREVLIPHGQTILEYDDHLTLLGGWEALAAARDRIEAQGLYQTLKGWGF